MRLSPLFLVLVSACLAVSMDVTSLNTNIPHEEGRNHRTSRIRRFLWGQSPYAHQVPKKNALPNSNYLQTHGTAMGTKMAVAFANIFMARIEKSNIESELHQTAFLDKEY